MTPFATSALVQAAFAAKVREMAADDRWWFVPAVVAWPRTWVDRHRQAMCMDEEVGNAPEQALD